MFGYTSYKCSEPYTSLLNHRAQFDGEHPHTSNCPLRLGNPVNFQVCCFSQNVHLLRWLYPIVDVKEPLHWMRFLLWTNHLRIALHRRNVMVRNKFMIRMFVTLLPLSQVIAKLGELKTREELGMRIHVTGESFGHHDFFKLILSCKQCSQEVAVSRRYDIGRMDFWYALFLPSCNVIGKLGDT